MKKKPKKNPVCYLERFTWLNEAEYVRMIGSDDFQMICLKEEFKRLTGYLPPKNGKRVKVRFSVEVVK